MLGSYLGAGCLDVMYVAQLASRSEALDFLHYLETGQHLGLPSVRLEKAAALIIEPLSAGARRAATCWPPTAAPAPVRDSKKDCMQEAC